MIEAEQVPAVSAPLPGLVPPKDCNYIAAFLTLACNLRCSYCITRFGKAVADYANMPGEAWIEALNRIEPRLDLPVTLQGGEPSLHPNFYAIINGLRDDLSIDVLTNLQFDVDEFMANVPPERLRREAPYASIRVSYHPEVMNFENIAAKVSKLLQNDYSVGIWAVQHPAHENAIRRAAVACDKRGIDFRTKEFLGIYAGQTYGTYGGAEAVGGRPVPVECRTTELIIGPSGDVFRCHSDLYTGQPPIGHIRNADFRLEQVFRPCQRYGLCNPCDVKVKTNRFQQFGHTSVKIRGHKSAVRDHTVQDKEHRVCVGSYAL